MAGRRARSSARPRMSTPATSRATSRRWRRGGATSSSTAPCRPTTATTTSAPTRWSRREAARLFRSAMAGDATEAEAIALRRHMLLEMARMSCDDGLVMTLHPGVRRNHHGPTTRGSARTPATTSRCGWSSLTRCGRCWSGTARTRASTSCCSPSTRPSSPARSRRWPASTRRVYVGAPWWFLDAPRRDPALPGCGHRDRRVLPHLRVHRRHPGVLLDPGPPRHVPPGRRRLPRPAGGRAPARRGRGRADRAIDLVADAAEDGVQAVTDRQPTGSELVPHRPRPGGRPGPPRAPRSRQLLPRPPGLVHRPRAGRRRVGHRGLHRPQHRDLPRA